MVGNKVWSTWQDCREKDPNPTKVMFLISTHQSARPPDMCPFPHHVRVLTRHLLVGSISRWTPVLSGELSAAEFDRGRSAVTLIADNVPFRSSGQGPGFFGCLPYLTKKVCDLEETIVTIG